MAVVVLLLLAELVDWQLLLSPLGNVSATADSDVPVVSATTAVPPTVSDATVVELTTGGPS